MLLQLLHMVVQLAQQAFSQVAAGNAWRIQLAHNFQSFVQIGKREVYRQRGARSGRRCPCARSPIALAGRRR